MSSKWSHLPADILSIIANRLNNNSSSADVEVVSVIHNLRLRSVCKSWRSSVPSHLTENNINIKLVIPFPVAPNPYLNPNRLGHFTLSHSTFYLLQQSHSPYSLLRVENNNNNNNKWLNPLSRTTFGLPKGFPESINLLDFRVSHIHTSHALRFVDTSAHPDLPIQFNDYAKKVAVSTSSSFAIMAVSGAKLWFYGPGGDGKWREINGSNYDDVIFHKGKFYAVDITGRIVSVDVSGLKAVEIVPRLGFFGHVGNFKNLVVCNGALYLIDKCLGSDDTSSFMSEFDTDDAIHLKIYKLNEENKEWERVYDLDSCVFFVGDDCSYSISARNFPAMKTNCVYFLDYSFIDANEDEEKLGEFCDEIGVYCLDDGICGPLANFPDHWPLFLPSPTFVKLKASKSKKK